MTSLALIATLLFTFVIGVLGTRWLMFGVFALDRALVGTMIVVPLVQACILIGWRRWSTRRRV